MLLQLSTTGTLLLSTIQRKGHFIQTLIKEERKSFDMLVRFIQQYFITEEENRRFGTEKVCGKAQKRKW